MGLWFDLWCEDGIWYVTCTLCGSECSAPWITYVRDWTDAHGWCRS